MPYILGCMYTEGVDSRIVKCSMAGRCETIWELECAIWNYWAGLDCVQYQPRELPFIIKPILLGKWGIPSQGSDGFEKFDRRLGRSFAYTSITELIKKIYRIYVINDFAHE